MTISRRAVLAALLILPFTARAQKAQGLIIHASPLPLASIEIEDGQGQRFGLPRLLTRPALVNFWASWCLPCVAEMPSLDRLKQRRDKDLTVAAISLDRMGKSAVEAAYRRLGIQSLDILVDRDRAAGEKLAIPVLPTTLLIGADGRERARFIGAADWDGPDATRLLDALATGSPMDQSMALPVQRATGPNP